jgi:hypothetical protein
LHEEKPKFGRFEVWGACSRCGARVRYNTLARERLTGLLVCTKSSGRPVRPCLDPWPPVYDFQASTDNSINPPPEPLPVRWGLDDIWSANKMKIAPADIARVQSYMIPQVSLATKERLIKIKTVLLCCISIQLTMMALLLRPTQYVQLSRQKLLSFHGWSR